MALSDADTARLASLRSAYDALISGAKVAKVNAFGRQVEYAQADMERLKAEIDQLVAADSTTGNRRGALRFRIR